MAGAELLRLLGPVQVGLVGERRAHLLAAMAVDHVDAGRLQRARGVDHVRQHRPPGDLLQHLRQRGLHPLAFAGGEDDDVQGCGHGDSCGGDCADSSRRPLLGCGSLAIRSAMTHALPADTLPMSLTRQARHYLLIGGVQWLVDWGVMVGLSHWGMPVEPANVAGRISGALLGYWLNGRSPSPATSTAVGRTQLHALRAACGCAPPRSAPGRWARSTTRSG